MLSAAAGALIRDQRRIAHELRRHYDTSAALPRTGRRALPVALPALDGMRVESETGPRSVAVTKGPKLRRVRVNPLPIAAQELGHRGGIQDPRGTSGRPSRHQPS